MRYMMAFLIIQLTDDVVHSVVGSIKQHLWCYKLLQDN